MEQCFRLAKSLTRTLLHRPDDAICGNVFCLFLALLLREQLRWRMAAREIEAERADLMCHLQEAHLTLQGEHFVVRIRTQGVVAQVVRCVEARLPPTICQERSGAGSPAAQPAERSAPALKESAIQMPTGRSPSVARMQQPKCSSTADFQTRKYYSIRHLRFPTVEYELGLPKSQTVVLQRLMMLRSSVLVLSSHAHSHSKSDTRKTSKATKRTIPIPTRLHLCLDFPGRLSWRALAPTTACPRIPPWRVQTDVIPDRPLTNLAAIFRFLEALEL